MKLFCDSKNYKIYNGSMLDMLEVIEENSIDSIVCDPPYELGFMGRSWDKSGIAFQKETWEKCLKVLKPGGYLLAFGGSRTFHRIAVAIEDAGFEIRDTIMWLYGEGFPKSMNIGLTIDKKNGVESKVVGTGKSGEAKTHIRTMKSLTQKGKEVFGGEYEIKKATNEWQGWGTALKPAYEPVIVARKPFKGTVADNVIKYGVGGINIDECRVGFEDTPNPATNPLYRQQNKDKYKQIKKGQESKGVVNFTSSKNDISNLGRFPANVIHDGSEEVISGFPNTAPSKSSYRGLQGSPFMGIDGTEPKDGTNTIRGHDDDGGSASRFFYTAKASKKDRDEGLDIAGFEEKRKLGYGYSNKIEPNSRTNEGMFKERETLRKNIHPTVKPCELMQYLVRLVSPKGAIILDPFMGSGSTGKAVMFENRERDANYKFVGIDLEKEYCEIAKARIDYALNKYEYDYLQELKQAEEKGQMALDLFGGDV